MSGADMFILACIVGFVVAVLAVGIVSLGRALEAPAPIEADPMPEGVTERIEAALTEAQTLRALDFRIGCEWPGCVNHAAAVATWQCGLGSVRHEHTEPVCRLHYDLLAHPVSGPALIRAERLDATR